MVVQKDRAVGLVLYISLVVIVDAYLNTGLYLPGLEKGSIRYSEICAAFLLFSPGPTGTQRSLSRAVTWPLGLYFGLLFFSAMRSDPIWKSLLEFRRVALPQIVAFLIAKRGLESSEAYRRFFMHLTTLVIIIAVFTFWDLFFDRVILKSDMLENGIYWFNRAQNRFGSFFLNPNYLAAFIVLVFPSAFVWTLNEHGLWPRLFAWAGLLALIFALVETQSRAPLLAFGIALVILIVGPCGGVSRKRRAGVLTLFVVLLAIVMPGSYDHAVKRFGDDSLAREMSTENGRSRETTWMFTGRMIADHPVIGIGFGEAQFTKFMDAYGFAEQYGIQSLDAPHNSYLQAAVYAGIPALALFLIANAGLLGRAAWISVRGAPEKDPSVVFGIGVGITGFLVCIYTDLQLFTMNAAPVYWVFFGLLLSLVAPAVQPAAERRQLATVALRPSLTSASVVHLHSRLRGSASAPVLRPERGVPASRRT